VDRARGEVAGGHLAGGLLAPREPGTVEADPVQGIGSILQAAADGAGVVFWAGDASLTQDDLYRHLRGINKVTVPAAAATDAQSRSDGEAAAQKDEMVIFRHADANVLAQVLPVLDKAQLARFFGPAKQVLFAPDEDWGGRIKRAQRAEDLPKSPAGPLALDETVISGIREARLKKSQRRIAAFLRDAAPDRTASWSDKDLINMVARSDNSATELGIRTEQGRGRLAYLMILTDERAAQLPEVRAIITNGESSPDNQVRRLIAESAAFVGKREVDR
jgi:hypothetical protein